MGQHHRMAGLVELTLKFLSGSTVLLGLGQERLKLFLGHIQWQNPCRAVKDNRISDAVAAQPLQRFQILGKDANGARIRAV